MLLPGNARKAALTTHVVASVGWLGAVAAFLTLAIAALISDEPSTVRALYVAMEVLGTAVLVPLSLASFASGLVQSLGTQWGLVRHYWVVLKASITVLATGILLLYLPTLRLLGDAAGSPALTDDRALLPSTSPILHAGAATVILLLAVFLSVFKPKGLTPYGWRMQQRRRATPAASTTPQSTSA